MEENGAPRAQQQTGQVWLPGITVNTPAPTAAINDNGAALASVSVNVMGGQGTLPYSRQAIAATTSNFVYQGASIAQEHVKELQLPYVGGMQSTGSTVQRCMSPCLTVLQLT